MKRLPLIRHIRFAYLTWRVHRFAAQWGSFGVGLGVPNQSDLDHLQRILKGKA